MNTHNDNQPTWQHEHTFGQDRRKSGELRTLIVVLLTAATMIIEITAGIAYGSMALLADGLHMASHAAALAIAKAGLRPAQRHPRATRPMGRARIGRPAAPYSSILVGLICRVNSLSTIGSIVASQAW